MNILVVGGTGLIGRQVVTLLTEAGHTAEAASPSTGVNSITNEGVDAAMAGRDAVIDLTNAMIFEEDVVVDFFTTSTRNLLAAEVRAGVRHHVALSIVGSDRLPAAGYMAGKVAQEREIRAGEVPFTIVRATQFYEFLGGIADAGTVDGVVRVTDKLMQPMASSEVARAVANAALETPAVGRVLEIAGPASGSMVSFVAQALAARGDLRSVVADADAGYFGIPLEEDSLIPVGEATLGTVTLAAWLAESERG